MMKNSIAFILLLIIIETTGSLNKVCASDTIKIHVVSKNRIIEGTIIGGVTISQKFYTYDDTLVREIRYNEKTGQISGYTFYFYQNNRLISEEVYEPNDSLAYVLKHEYDRNGNKQLTEKMVRVSGQMTLTGRIVRKFNKGNQVTREKKYVGKELGMSRKYAYNEAGDLLLEKSQYKPVYDTTISYEEKKYDYDTEDRIVKISVSGTDRSKDSYGRTAEYDYGDQGLVSGIKTVDQEGRFLIETVYKYTKYDALYIYQEKNSEGKVVMQLEYSYLKRPMDIGTQKSVLIR